MNVKEQLHAHCQTLIEKKIEQVKSELDEVTNAVLSETKSSMGDKYETGREMMMQEKNKLGNQMEILLGQLAQLNSIDPIPEHSHVKLGTLVETDKASYFISIPFGMVSFEGLNVFFLSEIAPIAKEMIGKKKGDIIRFNNQSQVIKSIS